ncbi:hypothetical protein GDO86_012707 [Hymenochirus boettgeri]|uniref:Uncharacterized protein n=1 Tax=Hymenochirus boettgeri TaxID=247094 RepID=A0A8T2ITU9_9PIPI|nr:hypothetical protein GDO86_012707 [Hymenochirus boettgeri]
MFSHKEKQEKQVEQTRVNVSWIRSTQINTRTSASED